MCGVRYEGLPGRLWTWYLCQLMSDTLLTDLSLHIHDNTLCHDILMCTNLGSLTEKRPRKVGYMLFIGGNSSVTPCVCIVYTVCSLCTFFLLVSVMFTFKSYMVRWKVVSMVQNRNSKPLTLGTLTQHVCAVDVSIQYRTFTPYPRGGEQICMSDHVRTLQLTRLCGAAHIDAF